MKRVTQILNQLDDNKQNTRTQKLASSSSPSDDDIVIVSGIRTAIGKAKRGVFKDTSAVQLLTPCLKHIAKDIDPKLVNDICVGSVLAPGGQRASECRMAAFLAGFPRTTTLRTVNRQCSSGLQAIADIASAIRSGFIQIGIAAGVETMSKDQMKGDPSILTDEVKMNTDALNCLLPMGITSENVVTNYGIGRKEQDELAYLSHQRAAAAKDKFRQEIVPINTVIKDEKTGKVKDITVIDDDGVRADTTFEGLSKLKPAFTKNGSTTAGNSSQVSDGAAAVLLMKRSTANKLGLKPRLRFSYYAVSGVDPAVMGIGPAFAIPAVCQQGGLKLSDIDLFEINEAFASQAVYCVKKLGLSWDNVNVNGGAIALGHPLGDTGCRMTVSLMNEMERRDVKRGIVSMCIGSGMGAAGIFERI